MNSEQLNMLWQNVCQVIKNSNTVDPSKMEAFFLSLQPQVGSDGFIMLTTDKPFVKKYVEAHYLEHIKQALYTISNIDFEVAIEIDDTEAPVPAPSLSPLNVQQPVPVFSNESKAPFVSQYSNTSLEHAAPLPGAVPSNQPSSIEPFANQEPIIQSHSVSETPYIAADHVEIPGTNDKFTSSLTFENYVIGESNNMAYSMALAVAETPGASTFNPLFIYGKSGLGKTHLMRAIENYILITQPYLRCVYVDSADFLSDYMDAGAAHDKEKLSYKNFKEKYESADVLLIDDIQYLQGKKQTLEIVFQIFNKMKDNDKQIVLSADRAPKNIDIDERYQSRFNSGVTVDVQPPEIETKQGIIRRFMNEYLNQLGREDIDIPYDVQLYMAEDSSSNIRELKSAVALVINSMIVTKKETITVPEAKVLLENHFSGSMNRVLTVEDIQKEVASFYKIKVADLVGQSRVRDIVTCRHIAIYLCRMLTNLPYDTIGRKFNKDHSTAIASFNKVEGMIKDSPSTAEEVETLKKIIKDL